MMINKLLSVKMYQCVATSKIWGIHPMDIGDTWTYSDLNYCKWTPSFYQKTFPQNLYIPLIEYLYPTRKPWQQFI